MCQRIYLQKKNILDFFIVSIIRLDININIKN